MKTATNDKRTANGLARLAKMRAEGKHAWAIARDNATGENRQLDDALHNALDCKYALKFEKPVHRQMQELSIQGFDHNEIGRATGYSPNYVSNVLRQPWSQERMIQGMKRSVNERITALLESAAPGAVENVVAMANDPLLRQQDPKAHLAANQEILNRFLGKPTQPLDHTHTLSPDEMTDEQLLAIASRGASHGPEATPNASSNGHGSLPIGHASDKNAPARSLLGDSGNQPGSLTLIRDLPSPAPVDKPEPLANGDNHHPTNPTTSSRASDYS